MADLGENRAHSGLSRRRLIALAGGTGVMLMGARNPVLAAWDRETPRQPAGPYYARFPPLSIDNDLLYRPGRTTPAEGLVIHLRGQVNDQAGRAIPGARVEIWQANTHGRYSHPAHAASPAKPDPNFQGYGHDVTDAAGRYRFRTIKPGPYRDMPGWTRPPHIHFLIVPPGGGPWTTQMYFEGDPLNDSDLILNRVGGPREKALVIVKPVPAGPGAEPDAQAVEFNIVLGQPGVERKPT